MRTKYCRFAISAFVFLAISAPSHAKKRDSDVLMPDLAAVAVVDLEHLGADALKKGDAKQAINIFSELVARQPRNGSNQTLLGLSYQVASQSDPQAIELALAGYDLAMQMEPGQFWPAALAGRAAFDMGRYSEALSHFSRALILRPTDHRLALAVASAAYMSGDIALADLSARRAVALDGGSAALRMAAIAAAAGGDAEQAELWLARIGDDFPAILESTRTRVAQLLQTAATDISPASQMGAIDFETGSEDSRANVSADPSPDQISLDVAIILAQNTRRERTGFNLLDGLGLQYGFNRQGIRTSSRINGDPDGNSYQRVLTTSISVPQLNYNLNLFNRGGQFYSVVARPQLTAYRGEESEFFIGRTLKVAVGGINLGALEQIDIGIEMKVTPLEITAEGALVRIETGRSFLTSDPAGSFNEALTTFRQKVAATAEIRFGETLLLSGLSENVEDRTFSKTPLLGDIPIIGNAFNERNNVQRRDSVMVFVTPSRPAALPGRPWARSEHVERLARLWTDVIDPGSNAEAAENSLKRSRVFTRMIRGDAPMNFPGPREALNEALEELIIPGSR